MPGIFFLTSIYGLSECLKQFMCIKYSQEISKDRIAFIDEKTLKVNIFRVILLEEAL